MKKIIYYSILLVGITCTISCKKDSSTNPASFTFPFFKCKLVNFELYQSAGGGNTDTTETRYSGDSIISTTKSYGLRYTAVFLLDRTHKSIIERDYNSVDFTSLSEISNYYLNNSGYVDSVKRTSAITGLVDYRDYITRNSSGQITHEILDFITYGYDTHYYYKTDGNYDYVTNNSLYPGGSYNDSSVYTFKPQFNTGAPQYVLNELFGKTSKNLVATKQIYDRTTMALKKTINYNYVFDTDNTVIQISQVSGANTLIQNFQYNCN